MAADIGSRVADELRFLKQPPGQQLVPKEKPPATGQMFRGIGSLMRGRISPIVTAAQLFWNEIPESVKDDAGAVVDWLRENKMQDLVGLEKSGLEYFKQALMPTAQEPKGIMSLPPMLQSGEYASDTVEGRVPVYHGTPSPEITGGRFDVEGRSLVEDPLGQGAAMKGSGQYSAQALGVAEDYFDKEPRGRVLLNNKLLPKVHKIPILNDREEAEKFAKDFGVDVEDLRPLQAFLSSVSKRGKHGVEVEIESLQNSYEANLSKMQKAKRRIEELEKKKSEYLAGQDPLNVKDFLTGRAEGSYGLDPTDLINSARVVARKARRDAAEDLKLLELARKYNLKSTPGALVEFAYHPDDWKNMIDLDMKMSNQPEVLEKVLQMPSAKRLMEDNLMPGYIRQLDGQELSVDLLEMIKRRGKRPERQAKIILAKEFADVGIPGNKFFDQQSRYADPPPDASKPIGFTLNGDTMQGYLAKIGKRMGLTGFGNNTPLPVMQAAEEVILFSGGLPEALDLAKSLDFPNAFSNMPPEASNLASNLVTSLIKEMVDNKVKLDFEYPEVEDTRTKNAVVWDQKAMDRATKPVVLEGGLPPRSRADGGFVDKSLYN